MNPEDYLFLFPFKYHSAYSKTWDDLIAPGRRAKSQAVKTAKQLRARAERKQRQARKRRNKGGQG